MDEKDFLTIDEVANELRVSRKTVHNLIQRGWFPGAYKIDPTGLRSPVRIPKTDLEAYIQAQRNRPLGKK